MQWLKTKTIEQALADSDEPGRQLQRTLGVFDLMILGLAVAVGAGIFSVGARGAGSFAGPAVIFSFILAGLGVSLKLLPERTRVDVLLREEDGAPFVLEINTIPGMTPSSLLPKAAAASGWPYEDLCEKIVELSLATPRK